MDRYRVRIEMEFQHLPPHPRRIIPLISHLIELLARQGWPVPVDHRVQIHQRIIWPDGGVTWAEPKTGEVSADG